MKSLKILNSIGNNQNNVWDKGVYLPIEDTRSYGIASNVEKQMPVKTLPSHNFVCGR